MIRARKLPARVSEQSRFGPSLEWESLPRVGGVDRAFRAMVWRWIIAGTALFWGGVIWRAVRW